MLVEDNSDDELLTLRAFKKNNISNEIVIARDGVEALDYLFATGPYSGRNPKNLPQIILLDLKLPKVNGIEVLQKIRADKRTKNIPVVVLTSSREDPDIQKCYDLGVNSYVVKPVEFDAFQKAISGLGLYWMIVNHQPQ